MEGIGSDWSMDLRSRDLSRVKDLPLVPRYYGRSTLPLAEVLRFRHFPRFCVFDTSRLQ